MSGELRLLPISAAIIARDEERDLPGAIASVPFAAEVVVVVDAATTDGTREAARALHRPERPVRVLEREWGGHVDQKAFALSRASSEWVLCLDADERVSEGLRRAIEELFARGPRADGYRVDRRTRYLGRWMAGSGWWPDRKLRLARKAKARWVGIDPHDRLEVEGRVEDLRGELLHRSYRDLSDHLRKLDLFTGIAAREKRRRGRRAGVLRLLVHPPARLIKMLLWKGGWRDGVPGFIAAGMGAFYAFLKYARLWELEEEERRVPAAGATPDTREAAERTAAGGPG